MAGVAARSLSKNEGADKGAVNTDLNKE